MRRIVVSSVSTQPGSRAADSRETLTGHERTFDTDA
jgi:hypothetical protein